MLTVIGSRLEAAVCGRCYVVLCILIMVHKDRGMYSAQTTENAAD
jgi:hypothetical protein